MLRTEHFVHSTDTQWADDCPDAKTVNASELASAVFTFLGDFEGCGGDCRIIGDIVRDSGMIRIEMVMCPMELVEELLQRVGQEYLDSADFNGYRFGGSLEKPNLEGEELRKFLKKLVESDKFVVQLAEFSINPMIRYHPDASIQDQLKMLDKANFDGSEFVVLYPSKNVLQSIVDPSKYEGRPFSLMLAYGEAQLDYRSFDLSVLERYRNDPRYYYEVDDIFGRIAVNDEDHATSKVKESDRAFIQTFGFSYDEDMNRAVAVFIRYLHNLTPEHQRVWHTHLLDGEYELHPDYYRASILGQWALSIPIFTAFCLEIQHINKMCELMDRPWLFRNNLKDRPSGFAFLIRPTAKEYYDFVHLLDKVMSDNINVEFFQKEVPHEEEIIRKDGKIEVRQMGSIRQFENWMTKKFRLPDPEPIQQMFAAFKKVRKLRQQPAHTIHDNTFDQEFFKQQRNLIIESYKAMRVIRLAFANHPTCRDYKVEEDLFEGKISTR